MTSLLKHLNPLFMSDESSSVTSLQSITCYPAFSNEILNIRWYHPHLERKDAVYILRGANRCGTYLMRNCSSGGPDDLTVSVKFPNDVKHFTVLWEGDGYFFGKHKFNNMKKLLEHFENKPIIKAEDPTGPDGEISVTLLYPYPRVTDSDDKAIYGTVSQHAEYGARPVDIHSRGKTMDPEFEIRQKSGYLTKRGEIVKSDPHVA